MFPHRFKVPPKALLPFLALTIFIIQIGLSISGLPSTQLMQDIICKTQHSLSSSNRLLPEQDCHDDNVQRELNFVSTGILISVTIGGMFPTQHDVMRLRY